MRCLGEVRSLVLYIYIYIKSVYMYVCVYIMYIHTLCVCMYVCFLSSKESTRLEIRICD
jgi:hypothetical protein